MYDAKKSKSHKDLLSDVSVEFGSGTLYGAMGSDTFYISDLAVENMKFLAVTR